MDEKVSFFERFGIGKSAVKNVSLGEFVEVLEKITRSFDSIHSNLMGKVQWNDLYRNKKNFAYVFPRAKKDVEKRLRGCAGEKNEGNCKRLTFSELIHK